MTYELYLPRSTQRLITNRLDGALNECNPSLILDKYSVFQSQIGQRKALERVCGAGADPELVETVEKRRRRALQSMGARMWVCETTGPLTLHLSRASALENAGICLHPLYGFVYLPGSGLKGMARAYAETVWLPQQVGEKNASENEPSERIRRVFGHTAGEKDPKKYTAGSVIFHDAWPEARPGLEIDIVNCHHAKYYQGEDAPGDWESPIPVTFLAIGPGHRFTFALGKRAPHVSDADVELAREWLTGALVHLGAGAKTAAGYGCFKPVDSTVSVPALPPSEERRTFKARLELVTPAFLAGAHQGSNDCDLRGAALRGLLRWWWRTLYADCLDIKSLRALESSIWGDTNAGSPITIRVTRLTDLKVSAFIPQEVAQDQKLPLPDLGKKRASIKRRISPGYVYHAMGMFRMGRDSKDRSFADPKSAWQVRIVARATTHTKPDTDKATTITADMVLKQAVAALWLLCHYGGVGAKSRKGYGSLKDLSPTELESVESGIGRLDLADCLRMAQELRERCGYPEQHRDEPDSPAWRSAITMEETVRCRNSWHAVHAIGEAMRTFAGERTRDRRKWALGLPRKLHEPYSDNLTQAEARAYLARNKERYASPIHFHVAPGPNGQTFVVRFVAFPAKYLPDFQTSKSYLCEVRDSLGKYRWESMPDELPHNQSAADTVPAASSPDPLAKGSIVPGVIVSRGVKKIRAKETLTNREGDVLNPRDVPSDVTVDSEVYLKVLHNLKSQITFDWVSPEEAQSAEEGADREEGQP